MKTYNIKRAFKGLNCARCKEELNTAEKHFLPSDTKEWYCQNCSNEGKIFCSESDVTISKYPKIKEFAEENSDIVIVITVFLTRYDETTIKNFGLYKNHVFKELKNEAV